MDDPWFSEFGDDSGDAVSGDDGGFGGEGGLGADGGFEGEGRPWFSEEDGASVSLEPLCASFEGDLEVGAGVGAVDGCEVEEVPDIGVGEGRVGHWFFIFGLGDVGREGFWVLGGVGVCVGGVGFSTGIVKEWDKSGEKSGMSGGKGC